MTVSAKDGTETAPNASLCFFIPLGVAAGSIALLTALGAVGWPGDVGASGQFFCEAQHAGPIKQPANTLSNAGFYLVGLWIGWQGWRDVAARKAADWRNKIVTTIAYPTGYAVSSVLIGFGSSALHASTTPWGVELDHLFMHLWGAWCVAFAAVRLFRRGDREFISLYLGLAGTLLTRVLLGRPYTIAGSTLFGLLIAASIAIELVGLWRNRQRRRMDLQYLTAAIVTFLAAYACDRLSTSSGPWCDPESFWQGHAAWHLLCAGSTAFVYLYGRSERSVAPETEDPVR